MKIDVLELLEFPRVRDLLVGLAASHLGKERLRELAPLSGRVAAEAVLAQVACLSAMRTARTALPTIDLLDLSALLGKLDREGTRLEAEECLALGNLLERTRAVREHADASALDIEVLRDLFLSLEPLPHLEQSLQKTFEPTGEIKDSASPALKKIRRERERLRGALRRGMEKHAANVSDGTLVTVRDGRFVLSLPHKKERSVQGIIHDRSGTGATVYLEPMDMVEQNNQLSHKDAEEFEEIQRILLVLTREFAKHGHALEAAYEALGELDDLDARAKLAARWRSRAPRFVDEPRVDLVQARHPLLLEARDVASSPQEAWERVIPLTLRLDSQTRLLLISGPNMGGKTVALKCVGLLTLMAQAGLFLPVEEEAVLGWFEAWAVDVGDDQSLEGDLSTFGGHLRRWADALDKAGPGTLILFDELGSGTDPTEGAALAQSVLEGLVAQGTLGVVTTHLGALKRFAAATPGVENASMIFDGDSGSPTFTLAPGVPGDSHALDMAAHLGFPLERVSRAEALLTSEERTLKKLIADVEAERDRLRDERLAAGRERARARTQAAEAKEALERVLSSRQSIRDRAARQARDILQRAQNQARELERSGRAPRGEASRLQRDAAARQAELARLEAPAPNQETPLGPAPKAVETGGRYMAISLGGPVTVLRSSPGEDRVLVDRRGMKIELPLADLRLLPDAVPPAEPQTTRRLPEAEDAPREVHLLGKRREEALALLDQALDRALLAGLVELRVIHGFGTGTLMQAVREFVHTHPAVDSYRAGEKGEGGGGATIVRLKDA